MNLVYCHVTTLHQILIKYFPMSLTVAIPLNFAEFNKCGAGGINKFSQQNILKNIVYTKFVKSCFNKLREG